MKAGLWIDAPNLHFALLQLGIKIDMAKLLPHISQLVRARIVLKRFFYDHNPESPNQGFENFVTWLKKGLGYETIRVEKKLYHHDTGRKAKSLTDWEIAFDILDKLKEIDILVLLSGDSDYVRAIKSFQKFRPSLCIVVLSTRQTLSRELRETADAVYYLEDMPELLQQAQARMAG